MPVRFRLLRLPYLCIEAIILNSKICDLINFSSISKRTNRVTDSFILVCPISNNFHYDPKLFDAKNLVLTENKSAGWVTGDYLSQLGNVHWFDIDYPQFGIKDVVEFITGWFQSLEKTNLKAITIMFKDPFNPEDLVLDHLQPMRWDPERRPAVMINPLNEESDFSEGLDIVRSDGQLATIVAGADYVMFYVWSEREIRGLPYK